MTYLQIISQAFEVLKKSQEVNRRSLRHAIRKMKRSKMPQNKKKNKEDIQLFLVESRRIVNA
jgi:hypothetical protein